jgi:hypothetical protein
MEVTETMLRKIVVLLLTVFLTFVTASISTGSSDDSKFIGVEREVLNGTVNPATINTLEEMFKKDPRNANLAALLAGAYGTLAEQNNDSRYAGKAKSYASKAMSLNPNSKAAQIASLGAKAYSSNKADRDAAIAGLKQLGSSLEGRNATNIRNFLIGKAHALNGNTAEARQAFSASRLSIASQAMRKLSTEPMQKDLKTVPLKTVPMERELR